MSSDSTRPETNAKRPRRRGMILAAAAVAVLAGAGAIYGIGFAAGNGEAQACAADQATLARVKQAAQGEVAAVIVPDEPSPLPQMSFVDGDGKTRSVADWKGKVVLLNLWATWCVPCREEMPALDALQRDAGGDDFEVVPVNIDRGDDQKPKKFYAENGITSLGLYQDSKSEIFQVLKRRGQAFGLPTTLILDREGCEIAHLPGPAEWDSDDAKAFIRAAVGDGASG